MSELINASDLEVGDLYRTTRGLASSPSASPEVYRVASIREVRYLDTYTVIEAANVRTGLAAQLNLLREQKVFKLERQQLRDLRGYLDYMPDGEEITIARIGGEFWC